MKAAVIVFPGSNCDQDALLALEKTTGVPATAVFHKDRLPPDVDLVILPGGFSYGDYLRCGAIARFSPVMKDIIKFAGDGGTVVGICNGFQILVEAHLLPGALMRNRSLHFRCKWVHIRTERTDTRFTNFEQRVMRIPIAHASGNYFIDEAGYWQLEENGQILFRYCDAAGEVADADNPNGSVGSIAGIMNAAGNVMGMMPHPERAMDARLGSEDGLVFWRALLGVGSAEAVRG